MIEPVGIPVMAAGPKRLLAQGGQRDLPRWPIFVLLVGFPAWWALGATPFAPILLAFIMIFQLILAGKPVVFPGLMAWMVFLLWVLASAINLSGGGAALAFGMRFGELFAIGVFMLYVANAPRSLPKEKVVDYLVMMWVAIIALGFLALIIPDMRLRTPVAALIPSSIGSNELLQNLVSPPLAEVQQPWGAPKPFNRPAAPFPYANSWGVAYVVLTPIVFARIAMTRSVKMKIVLAGIVGLSLIPAVATSNRGMFVGLAVAVVYAVLRFLGHRRMLLAAWFGAAGIAAAAVLVGTGAIGAILARQEFSDSTGGRLALYEKTLAISIKAPLLGYGSPRMDETIGVSLGTQGYVWMLMFSYGFVGLGLFLYFLVGGIVRTWSVTDTEDIWLHSVLVAGLALIPFYSLSVIQLGTVCIVMVLLVRQKLRRTHG